MNYKFHAARNRTGLAFYFIYSLLNDDIHITEGFATDPAQDLRLHTLHNLALAK